jgi:hypothetical protein
VPRRAERALAALFLLGLLLAVFWKAALGGRVLGAVDVIFASPFFAAHAPPGFRRPANGLLFDAAYQFIPWRRVMCDALRAGRLPLWNPDSLSGTPFVATMQSAVFYPLSLVLCALPLPRQLVWSAIARLWIAGFATYLLARRYGVGLLAALVGGISFMLSGFLVVWLEHPHVNVAVWLPVVLLLDERLLEAATPRGRCVALFALAVGVMLTGGHVETAAHVLFALAVYHAVRAVQLRADWRRVLLGGVAVLLGAALAAPQLLPFLEWLPRSAEVARRRRRRAAARRRGILAASARAAPRRLPEPLQ